MKQDGMSVIYCCTIIILLFNHAAFSFTTPPAPSRKMPFPAHTESLRVLCLDGGGIKGYTSLLILKRIFRTMQAEGSLESLPKPCDIFDLIVGTSTGGLIAVMLGRLGMSIDECIKTYESVGGQVFGRKIRGGKFGKMVKGLRGEAFYDIEILQEEVRKVLDLKEIPRDAEFKEVGAPNCKV
jgi:patatin-like phospholipase/acyl hydrolase